MRILFIGDVVGSSGRRAVSFLLPKLKSKYRPDFILANGENAAGGRGITQKIAQQFFEWGIDGITLGNHAWDNKEIFEFIDEEKRIVRPANYPPGTPGQGMMLLKKGVYQLAVINLQGQTYLPPLKNPFHVMDELLAQLSEQVKHIVVDFHAEATAEKVAMGWYLDGRVSAVVGTHTHVQTNDARILPRGTAYQTDVGMTGPMDGIIGMRQDMVLKKFLTQLPVRFEVDRGAWQFNATLLDLDDASGKAVHIQPLFFKEDEPWMD
ncbi:MAG: metallophosphoesterase [Bacillaceae bacterium G1]|nr:TIGR00282 family metallophosphoesterase [Bacillota bacterium]OJF16627.1 MAG: metallophosphoesterase [Bacillaceae bacterium G1]